MLGDTGGGKGVCVEACLEETLEVEPETWQGRELSCLCQPMMMML